MDSLRGRLRVRFRTVYGATLIGVATTLLSIFWLQNQKIVGQAELRGYDTLYGIRGGQPVNLNIVVVGVDQQSLSDTSGKNHGACNGNGAWPIRRSCTAAAINYLHRSGARVIGLDFEYFSPSRFGKADDAAMAQAIKNAGNVVLENVIGTADANIHIQSETTVSEPIRAFSAHAAGTGFANIAPDADEVNRWAPVSYPLPGQPPIPSFAAAVAAIAQHRTTSQVLSKLPQDGLYVSYIGDQRPLVASDLTFPIYSLDNVALDNLPASYFRNKIVLIIPDAIEANDIHQTPVDQMYDGFIQANIVNTILRGDWILSVGSRNNNLILLIVGLLASLVAARFGIGWSSLGTAVLAVGFFLLASFLFSVMRTWVYIVTPELTIVLVYGLVMAFRFATEERLKRKLKGNFSQYLTQEIVELFTNSPDPGRELAPGDREISVLFVDVRGFTSMSEHMAPQEVVAALDIYLEELTESIEAHGGMINKYVGDEIIGVWNALHVKPQPNHAMLAVRAGLDMIGRMDGINERLRGSGLPAIRYGIGINSGRAVVGQMGTRLRKQYDIIGDTVNTGARLCSAAGGGEIIIGQKTWELIGDQLVLEETDPLRLKGKSDPLRTFACLGLRETGEPGAAPAGAPAPA